MTENIGFSRCIFLLNIALADVITYVEDTITLAS